MTSVSIQELRAWANHPAANHMVPLAPSTLRSIADEIELLRALLRRSWLRPQYLEPNLQDEVLAYFGHETEERYDCPVHGSGEGRDCPRC